MRPLAWCRRPTLRSDAATPATNGAPRDRLAALPREVRFGPYRLDLRAPRLWNGTAAVTIQARPLAVLCHLAARPGTVVGRDELIAALWAETFVTRAVLKVAIRAVREAIGDDAEAPRYIETVGREGYRFIGTGDALAGDPVGAVASPVVGRDGDLARLHAALARCRAGARTMLFVGGEAGIGKTTLLDRFVDDVARLGEVRILRGQCLDQYGESEAYLPILDAFGTHLRDGDDRELREVVARHAPSWAGQLAALAPPTPARAVLAGVATAPARMLREMADVLDVVTRDRPLLLVLEDLQWSDRSSVDLLSLVAQRRHPARLLVVGSLRADEMRAAQHPLHVVRHELQAKGLCDEIALTPLSGEDVVAYLAARFDGVPSGALRRVAARVHERTEGNGLFMVNLVNDLVAHGLLVQRDGRWHVDDSSGDVVGRVPAALQELLARRLRALPPDERRLLEAASVAGDEFAVATVAAAIGGDEMAIEDGCERLAAQGLIIADAGVAEWPDGSFSGRYRFTHALHRQVLYDGVAEARRVAMHRAIGERLTTGFAERAGDHAAELAMHFTRGRAHAHALRFHELAAAAAVARQAPHEATAHWRSALDALAHLPARPEHGERELGLVVSRATLLMATQGYGAPETEAAFARARSLCDALPTATSRHPVLRGLLSHHQVRARLGEARGLAERLLAESAAHPHDRVLHVQAHYGAGTTLFHLGELDRARRHLDAALHAYDPETHRRHILVYGGYDPGVACALWLAWTATLQGDVDDAARWTRDGLALAHRHGDAFSLAWACQAAGISHQLLGSWSDSGAACADGARRAAEHGFPYLLGMATVNHGWALLMQGDLDAGIPLVRDGIAMVDATGAALVRPSYLAMLAGTYAAQGDRTTALDTLDEGLAESARTGECIFDPLLLAARAQLLDDELGTRRKRSSTSDAAEASLERAVAIAHAQGAYLLELRAAMALARRRWARGRVDAARAVLGEACGRFADRASATGDVAAARQLLAELNG